MRTLLILLSIFFGGIAAIRTTRILNSTTLYFVTPKYFYFEYIGNNCQDIPCENGTDQGSICKRCDVHTYDNMRIGTKSPNKFVLVYATVSTKPFSVSNPADKYSLYGFNIYNFRIFKIQEEYILTADKTNFVDASPNHDGNFIELHFVMGYDFP